ncbi:hypothetical protein Tco_1301539 [Tanacetum coccineum]
MAEAKTSKKIDWNDPSVIRPIFEKVWDFNQHIEPMEHETEKMKSPEKMKSSEKIEEEDVDTQEEMKEVVKELEQREEIFSRKSTREETKLEEDVEKEELKGFLYIIPREEVPLEVESLSTNFLIVDWKTCVLTENFMYYQVFRGDGSSKNYKVLSEMLEDFVVRIVVELYGTSQDKEWYSHTYADREEIPSKSRDDFQDVEEEIREVEEMFERIISKGRRLEDLIQKKLDDLKDNHKFRGRLLGINLHKT